MPPPNTVTLVKNGDARDVPVDQAGALIEQGYTIEGDKAREGREAQGRVEERNSGPAGTARAALISGLRGVTLGGSDVALRALGGDDYQRTAAEAKETHPYVSTAAEIGGSILAPGVGELGAAVRGEGGLARSIAAGAAEGGLIGIGNGVSDLALSDQPITFEHAASVLSSNALFGGTVGGVAGGLGKVAEKGLLRAKAHLEAAADAGVGLESAGVAGDLAGMDAPALRAARQSELDSIEAARVPQRQAVADDLSAFRRELKDDQKIYLATKGIKEAALPEDAKGLLKIQEIGKTSLEADRQLDRLLRNPIRLAEKPETAIGALQQQEAALMQLSKREPTLRAMYAADESGTRAAALDAVPGALDRNRALQARIRELAAQPASPRLSAIDNAKDALSIAKPAETLPEKMFKGAVFGKVAGLAAMTPLAPLSHAIGAKASQLASDVVFGRLGKAVGEAQQRTSKAIGSFMSVAQKATPAAPVVATKILSRVRFAPEPVKTPDEKRPTETLASLYKARADEIKSQTAYDATGTPRLRPEARQGLARRLDPIRVASPIAADRLETIAARRIEYLASKIPRRPDLDGIPTGPDRWQPSDMAMRSFARMVHAVEDPGGVEERLASGAVTPEDADAYRAVYPERYAALQQQIMQELPKLRKQLPYQRRIALSIFSGRPVDPAMTPNVLAVLQSGFMNEPGSEGGTQAPSPQPSHGSFGSIKKSIEQPTAAQHRGNG